jgi:hypothetical protein
MAALHAGNDEQFARHMAGIFKGDILTAIAPARWRRDGRRFDADERFARRGLAGSTAPSSGFPTARMRLHFVAARLTRTARGEWHQHVHRREEHARLSVGRKLQLGFQASDTASRS